MVTVGVQSGRSPAVPATAAAEVAIGGDERRPIAPTPRLYSLQTVCVFHKQLEAMGQRGAPTLTLSAHDHAQLLTWSKSQTLAARVVVRSRIVLLLAHGATVETIATELRIARGTVRLWRRRFLEHGLEGLVRDARGRGRKPALSGAARQALQQEAAIGDALTLRERARQLGVSASTVSRWRRRAQ